MQTISPSDFGLIAQLISAAQSQDCQLALALAKQLPYMSTEQWQEAMQADSHTDWLTGLANRRAFERDLASAQAEQSRYGRRFAVAMIDANGLKQKNDSEGHQAGDRLLKDLAILLTEGVRASDKVYRLGGDEYAVLADMADSCYTDLRDRLRDLVKDKAAVGCSMVAGNLFMPLADARMYRHKAEQKLRIR